MARDTVIANPNTCFVAFEMGRLLPPKDAAQFSTEYNCTVAYGSAEVVGPAESLRALKMIMLKYAPHMEYGEDYNGISERDLKLVTVVGLRVTRFAGKANKESARFPGAYTYESVREQDDGNEND